MLYRLSKVSLIRNDKYLLNSIDWTIDKNDYWIVFGKNGSGKSLLLQILLGYLSPSSGEIVRFDELRPDLRELRKNIGFVSSMIKNSIYPNENALDFVMSGFFGSIGLYDTVSQQQKQQALSILEWADCSYLINREMGFLSDGEKARLMIARSLVHRPKVLVLDEPCMGMDIEGRETILSLIENASTTKIVDSIIMVTHYLEEITPSFNQILFMQDGKILKSGPIKNTLTTDNLKLLYPIDIEIQKINDRYHIIYNHS